jgi:hypothetical protein
VFAASLVAHLALFGVWMASRPPPPFVEPPVMTVALVTLQRPHAPARPRPSARSPAAAHAKAAEPPPSAPVAIAPPPVAPAPPAEPRGLSDEALLAGRNKDAAQLKAALYQRRHVSAWHGCNRLPGPPDWKAPPCPPAGSNEEAKHVLSLPDLEGHGEIARKDRIQAYKDGKGPYPGASCVIFHRC